MNYAKQSKLQFVVFAFLLFLMANGVCAQSAHKELVLYDINNDPNQYSGFGVDGRNIRYQADATTSSHIFYSAVSATVSKELMRIKGDGSVCIGSSTPQADAKLTVDGNLYARGVVIPGTWADFVFDPEYKLKPLSEVKVFIAKNGHLPGVPSAAEIKEKGIDIAPMVKVQMQKIEELTLYILEQQKKMEELEKKVAALSKGQTGTTK